MRLKWLVLVSSMVLPMAMVNNVRCGRVCMTVKNGSELEYAVEGRLAKGSVPPSAPSPCLDLRQPWNEAAKFDEHHSIPTLIFMTM